MASGVSLGLLGFKLQGSISGVSGSGFRGFGFRSDVSWDGI